MARERKPKTGSTIRPFSFSIYLRQHKKLIDLVKADLFINKSEIVRQSLDLFFLFPFTKDDLNKNQEQKIVEKYYNSRIIKILNKK